MDYDTIADAAANIARIVKETEEIMKQREAAFAEIDRLTKQLSTQLEALK